MSRTAVLGLPRMGADRELKFALESYWREESGGDALLETAASLRAAGWRRVQAAGIGAIPSGDFSLYDHVLDTAWALGAIPDRFGVIDRENVADYFVLARGDAARRPLEMTKWFDTNYHFLVPELSMGQRFDPLATHWTAALAESAALGIPTRPVLLGPLSFLLLAKGVDEPLALLDEIVPAYEHLLRAVVTAGATEIQLDEPVLALDRSAHELDAFASAFTALRAAAGVPITLTSYFAGLDSGGTLERVIDAEPDELHLDLVRAPAQLTRALQLVRGRPTRLSLGLIDGRNVWAADLDVALDRIDLAIREIGTDRVTIAPSCSMLHLPHTVEGETGIDPEVRAWLAFANERLAELSVLGELADAEDRRRDDLLASARELRDARRTSTKTNNADVRARTAALQPEHYARPTPAADRRAAQHTRVPLPELPTTTIGSYPQTAEIRQARRDVKSGAIERAAYERLMENEIAKVVSFQERIGLDVLVHGEPERNDMVEYFGEQLAGFAFSANGWVQSYGSRCVKPPILFGDVSRPEPMTVDWWRRSQAMTERPMKGMLTGPVTILEWSFVRDDQPHEETCTQIALAIQDEVVDLEAAGCFAIQVDEAALREGQPLQREAQDAYNRWAVDCFRLTVAPARADTQIHTHMCYSEFNDMMEHIVRLDADVISIEASRSDMDVLDAFTGDLEYPNDIGPGVYDIHSPRVPSVEEIERLIELAEVRVGRERLWVNPDCGLKTRSWADVEPALEHMMQAAEHRRAAVPAVKAT